MSPLIQHEVRAKGNAHDQAEVQQSAGKTESSAETDGNVDPFIQIKTGHPDQIKTRE